MASSYSFFPDGDTIIKASLRRVRGYDPEQTSTITTTQYSNARETLNFLLAHWQALGLPVWCRKTTSKALTAADGDYTIGSGGDINVNHPLAIYDAWLRDTNNVDVPLMIIGEQEYYDLSTKSAQGRPSQLYFSRDYLGDGSNSGATAKGTIYLWPTPDTTSAANYTLYLRYQRPLLDFNASADALDMPQEWYETVRVNLAYKIAPEYGMQRGDYQDLKEEAKDTLELALEWDTEQVSIFFKPNTDD